MRQKNGGFTDFFTLSKSSVFNFNQPLMTLYSAESEELSSSVFAASSFP